MDSLPEQWETGQDFAEQEDRYSGGGHATEEPAGGRERAAAELIATIRQASRELALIMAEIESDRRMT